MKAIQKVQGRKVSSKLSMSVAIGLLQRERCNVVSSMGQQHVEEMRFVMRAL